MASSIDNGWGFFKDAVNDYLDGEVVDTGDVVASLNFATA